MTFIQLRHDTAANWASVNPVLLAGECGVETDTNKFKFGNGTDNYNDLPYATGEVPVPDCYTKAETDSLLSDKQDTFITNTPLAYTPGNKYQQYTGIVQEVEPYNFGPIVNVAIDTNTHFVFSTQDSDKTAPEQYDSGQYSAYVDIPLNPGTLIRVPQSPTNTPNCSILLGYKDDNNKFTPLYIIRDRYQQYIFRINSTVAKGDVVDLNTELNSNATSVTVNYNSLINASQFMGICKNRASNTLYLLEPQSSTCYKYTSIPEEDLHQINYARFISSNFHDSSHQFGAGWFKIYKLNNSVEDTPANTAVDTNFNFKAPTGNNLKLDYDDTTLGIQDGKLTVVNGDPGGTIQTQINSLQNQVTSLESNKQNKLVAGDNITIDEATNTISATGSSSGGINSKVLPQLTPQTGDQNIVTSIGYNPSTRQLEVDYHYKFYENSIIEDEGDSTLKYPVPVNIANTDLSNLARIATNNMFANLMPDYTTGISLTFSDNKYTVPYDGIIFIYLESTTDSDSTANELYINNQLVVSNRNRKSTANQTNLFIPVKENDIITLTGINQNQANAHSRIFKLTGGSY